MRDVPLDDSTRLSSSPGQLSLYETGGPEELILITNVILLEKVPAVSCPHELPPLIRADSGCRSTADNR